MEPATASSPTAAPTPVAAASEPATALNTQSEDEARRAHEAAEAKRKAEWDDKQAEKRRAEQAALERLDAMGPTELLKAAAKRVSADTEKLTRRNMKESVAEFIQTKCIAEILPVTPIHEGGVILPRVACGIEIPGQLILFHAHIPGHGTSPKWFSIT